jgi:hypothetical protein
MGLQVIRGATLSATIIKTPREFGASPREGVISHGERSASSSPTRSRRFVGERRSCSQFLTQTLRRPLASISRLSGDQQWAVPALS